MPRITVDLDAAVLRDLKRLQKSEKKPLGQLISELVADIARKAQSVRIHPEGDGPIATAIRTNFTPAKISSDEFLLGLRKLLNFHSAQTTNLSRVLTTVDLSATEAARSVGRRR